MLGSETLHLDRSPKRAFKEVFSGSWFPGQETAKLKGLSKTPRSQRSRFASAVLRRGFERLRGF